MVTRMKDKNYHIDMTSGNLLKNVFLFSVPLMLTTCLQMIFNAADTIVVGKFSGEVALASVGATSSVIFLLISVFNGLSVGTNVVVSKYIGARNDEKTSDATHTSIWISLVAGVLLTVIGIVFSKPLLRLMSTPEKLLPLSSLYMKIYFAGIIFTLIYDFGTAILRSSGDTKRPLYFLALAGGLNVILNLLFVIAFKMSVAGVALATVISQGVSAVLTVKTLMNETNATKLFFSKLKLDITTGREIMMIGIPAGIQGLVFSFSNVVVQSGINSFNEANLIAGNSAALNLENFVYIGMDSFNKATATFTAANVGAGNYKQIKKILWLTMLLDVGSGLLISTVIYMNGSTFLGFYTNSADVVRYGMYRLSFVTLFLPVQGIADSFISSSRGMGYSNVPTFIMLAGICGVRLIWLWSVFAMNHTLSMLYICFPISWTVTGIAEGIIWFIGYRKFMKKVQ